MSVISTGNKSHDATCITAEAGAVANGLPHALYQTALIELQGTAT